MGEAAITPAAFEELALKGVPLMGLLGCELVRLEAGRCDVRLPYRDLLLRPGGTVSGPAMMGVADIALYGAVLSRIGPVPLAVTTDMTLHFMRRPKPGPLIARARVLKLGRALAVGEATLAGEDDEEAVCHVVGTYALPPAATPPAV